MRDRIRVEGLEIECIIGLHLEEREQPQPLIVDVSIGLDCDDAAQCEDLERSIDYAAVMQRASFLLQCGRFRLLETAAQTLIRALLLPPAEGTKAQQPASVKVRLSKPRALGGRGLASVEMWRPRRWLHCERIPRAFGSIDVLQETGETGVYRYTLSPGQSLPAWSKRGVEIGELVLGPGLVREGRPCASGDAFVAELGGGGYHNSSAYAQSLLCVAPPRHVEEFARVSEIRRRVPERSPEGCFAWPLDCRI